MEVILEVVNDNFRITNNKDDRILISYVNKLVMDIINEGDRLMSLKYITPQEVRLALQSIGIEAVMISKGKYYLGICPKINNKIDDSPYKTFIEYYKKIQKYNLIAPEELYDEYIKYIKKQKLNMDDIYLGKMIFYRRIYALYKDERIKKKNRFYYCFIK